MSFEPDFLAAARRVLVARYSPAEARVPKGQPTGGQWTAGAGGDSMNSNAEGFIAAGGRLAVVTPENRDKVYALYQQTKAQLDAKAPLGDLFTDTGKAYTEKAIEGGIETWNTVRVAQTKTGHIAGAISWKNASASDDLYIGYLGSMGISSGVGSALTRLAFKEAAKRGVGITGTPDSSAIPFWRKMGFTAEVNLFGPYNSMSISAEDVRRHLPK